MNNKDENKQKKSEKQSINEATDNTEESIVKIEPAKTEFGGRKGPEPTRFGDWEKNGRCIDF